MQTFGAIYIGTYEMSLRVYEVSTKKKYKELDYLRVRMELENDIQKRGRVSNSTMDVISETLLDFKSIMSGYGVLDYEVYITPAIKFSDNRIFLLEQVRQRTGIEINELRNSEQKFLDLFVLAERPEYEAMSKENIIVADVGGNSLQITLIYDGRIITTQHIMISTVRIRDQLRSLALTTAAPESLVKDIIGKEISAFKELFREYTNIKHLIIIGDYISDAVRKAEKKANNQAIERKSFLSTMDKIIKSRSKRISSDLEDYTSSDSLAESFIYIYYGIAQNIRTEDVWIMGTTIHEGMLLNYCFENNLLKSKHDFEADVLSACSRCAARYRNDPRHDEAMTKAALAIFDATKKNHGLSKRERLLLEVAVILHDCGRYVSLENRSESSYEIIWDTEIIGLSHNERKIVANVARYNRKELAPYEDFENLSMESYVVVAKLSAIIKLAAALDSTNNQRIKSISCKVRDDDLIVQVETKSDISVEKLDFESRRGLFEDIFNLRPVLKVSRIL